jgi:hypothetical protein
MATCVFVFITIIVVGVAVGVTSAQAVATVRYTNTYYIRYSSRTCYARNSIYYNLYTFSC